MRIALVLLVCAFGLAACKTPPAAPPAPAASLNAAQIDALRTLGFREGPDDWAVGLADKILFEFGSDKLNGQALPGVERIGSTLASVGITRMRVEGHTDSTGQQNLNERLSLRRAQVVADVLVGAGIPRDGIVARGLGSSHPVADNGTEAGRAENRRVAIVVPVP